VQPFAELLSGYLERPGVRQSDVAERAGVDPGTITKLKKGLQHTTRETVVKLAAALRLSARETDLLVASAHYLPPSLAAADDEALELVLELCRLLTGPALPAEERQAVRRFLALFVRLAQASDPPLADALDTRAQPPLAALDRH
jgi:transcriptional regulator with XRE-family HTH domain